MPLDELVVRRGLSKAELREAERDFYRRRLNEGPSYDKSRKVRHVCDVCQDRRYLLGWSFSKVMLMCRTCNKQIESAHLEKLGYLCTSDSRYKE
jgi:hypothetical protein